MAEVTKLSDQLLKSVGKTIAIEGQFPVPTQNGTVAYPAITGKLLHVHEEAVTIVVDDGPEVSFMFANARSIRTLEESSITVPRNRLVLPGA